MIYYVWMLLCVHLMIYLGNIRSVVINRPYFGPLTTSVTYITSKLYVIDLTWHVSII